MPRTLYHTSIKLLARDDLLTAGILHQIPRSNIHRWKGIARERYTAFDLNVDQGDDLLRQFAQNKTASRVFAAYVRLLKFVVNLAHGLPTFRKAVRDNMLAVVKLIGRIRNTISLARCLRLFNISSATFRQWSLETATSCFNSFTGTCNRIFPNQLSRPEVNTLRNTLTDPRFGCWPVSSIALHALRSQVLPLSLNTWYKYVRKLGLKRTIPPSRRKKTAISVRASRPHQIWHADVTCFVTADRQKHFIYMVTDNFSRKVLEWRVADTVSRHLRRQTIADALRTIRSKGSRVTLVTDGGPENNIGHVPGLDRKTALVDVHYSNSLIEAHFKVLKYNYLYRMDVRDGPHLKKILPAIISDYNSRPHISLDGLTPDEAERGLTLDRQRFSNYVQAATLERKIYNSVNRCDRCK